MMNQVITKEENVVIDCPICMDTIEGEKNKVITECGHCFHTSCLMKNVAHNGFGCPYCRDVMAEEPADNNTDDEYGEFSIDEEEEGPDYNDNVLRGARWLFQRAEGEEVDDEEDSVLDEEEEDEDEEQVDRPSVEYIVQKLVQRGVTMADVVKSILLVDHPEYQDDESFEREDNELFGKLRIIISNYQPPVPELVAIEEESNHHQSSRLRSHNSDELEVVLPVQEAMNLLHRGPIRKSVTVDKNDPDYERFSQYFNAFSNSEREKRYEKMSSPIQMSGRFLEEKEKEEEEASAKIPFNFQMKGSCRRNEVS
jgi:hypothetical protein